MTSSPKTRKRPGPAPTGKGTLIGVRLQKRDLTDLDTWRKRHGSMSRPEAIRQFVRSGLDAARSGQN